MFTVSGSLTANGAGVGGETIVLVLGWNSKMVNVTTQSNGSYSYNATAPPSTGPYNVDATYHSAEFSYNFISRPMRGHED
ncbi:MAG: hypothetical protein ABSF63_02905 [Candidatus Bathyarchaeia archaeon]|jgi:hypothetical protein